MSACCPSPESRLSNDLFDQTHEDPSEGRSETRVFDRALTDPLNQQAPTCLKILKASFRKQFDEILKITQKSMVDEVAPDYFKTGEQSEGAKAFLEKRKPNFKKFR